MHEYFDNVLHVYTGMFGECRYMYIYRHLCRCMYVYIYRSKKRKVPLSHGEEVDIDVSTLE